MRDPISFKMDSEVSGSKMCHLLRSKTKVVQMLASRRAEIKCLDEKKGWLKEQLSNVSQWVELLIDSKKEYIFEEDAAIGGLTVSKRLQLLENDQSVLLEKHQSLEETHELTLMKIGNLELQFQLMTMQENTLYDLLFSKN